MITIDVLICCSSSKH